MPPSAWCTLPSWHSWNVPDANERSQLRLPPWPPHSRLGGAQVLGRSPRAHCSRSGQSLRLRLDRLDSRLRAFSSLFLPPPLLTHLLLQWLSLIPFPSDFLRLVLVFGGTGLSLAFLLRNIYPVLATSPNASARLLIVAVAALHLAFGIGLWWGFMAGGSGALDKDTPVVPGEDVEALMRRLF